MVTVPAALLAAADRYADTPAVIGDGASLTWHELATAALDGANALVRHGIAPGDRVALWGANTVEWITADLAALCAGAVVVPVNHRYRAEEAAEIVRRSGASAVLADGMVGGLAGGTSEQRSLAEEMDELGLVEHLWCLDGRPPAGCRAWTDLSSSAGPSSPEVARRIAALGPRDPSHVQFTSGTTGSPKGALLTHGAMVGTTTSWTRIVGIRRGDRYPVVAPFSHVAGHKSGIVAAVVTGATLRPLRSPDPETLADLVLDGQAQVLQGAPALFEALLAALDRRSEQPRGVRIAVAGASVVAPSLVRRLRSALGVEAVLNGYGLSEATGVCTITRRDDPEDVVTTTCGRPVPGVEVRVVDESGRPCPEAGATGEVEVRGVNVMLGYFGDPVATAEVVRDGWLRTGDVGVLDRAGNLRIVDRLKDLILVGGFNVSPAEIERVLSEQAAVAQAAVVGIPDDRMGEVPVAFVVVARGQRFVPPDAEAECRRRLAGFKVPRRYLLVEALPLTPAGKVDKRALRARLATSAGGGGAIHSTGHAAV